MSGVSGRVLVLGDDTRSFLTVVRSLGRAGLEVHVAWCPLNSPALRSKHIHTVHRLPEYSMANRRWLDALINLLRQTAFDLVIPCHDSGLLPLDEYRGEIEPHTRLAIASGSAFRVFFSKAQTYDLARQEGIALPRQRVVYSIEEAEEAALEFGLPLVLKPQSSAAADNPWSRLSVRKIRDRNSLREIAAGLRLRDGVLAQENFRGMGTGVEALCREGEILTAFQHLRVHEPMNGGGSSYRKSAPLDPNLLDATARLMRATRYTGVAMVEFKVNPESGKWILIEVNPRFWGSLPLTVAAGLDFPKYLYDLLTADRQRFPTEYRLNVFARNWMADLYWLKANQEADHRDPDLMTLPWSKVAAEAVNILALRERSDTLTLDDPKPGVLEMAGLFRDRVSPRLERSGWWRRRQQRAAEAAVRRARRVLFLCYGNICRSPFAEYALRAMGGARGCSSTGFHAADSRSSPPAAVEAAAAVGVDLSAHRSRTCDANILDWADVILIFDRKHKERLAAAYPEALGKTHYLGALQASGPLEIEDPYGHGPERFGATYRMILRLLRGPSFQ